MIKKIKFYGNEFKIGKYALMTRIRIYKTVAIPSIFYNVETWSHISKKEIDELEKIQSTILKKICEQRKTTPYIGLLSELGIWPIEKLIEYRKIMLLHNIMSGGGERLIREIIDDQLINTYKRCWVEQVKEICIKYNININSVKEITKTKLKEEIKTKINSKLEEELQIYRQNMTKLRFITNFKQERYLEELSFTDSIEMIKIRLNMIETKCNYKGMFKTNKLCEICKINEDTTEHLLECKELGIDQNISIENISKPSKELIQHINNIIEKRKELGYEIIIGGVESSDSEDET